MRWGLVELFVNLEGITAPSQTEAVMAGIRRDRTRAETVQAALADARNLGCGFVELPGWSLVADQPPSWLLDMSAGLIVVAECLRPDCADGTAEDKLKNKNVQRSSPPPKAATVAESLVSPLWESYVLCDGRVLIGPARQHVASSGDPWDGEELSERGIALVRDLAAHGSSGRRWVIPEIGNAMLLVCGEANIIGGGGPAPCRHYDTVAAAGLTEESLAAVRVIANPAHTWTSLQALRDKRAWLSRSGILLHTANIHSAGWQQETEDGMHEGRASHKAAAAWVRGKAGDLQRHEGDGYVLKIVDWSPSIAQYQVTTRSAPGVDRQKLPGRIST